MITFGSYFSGGGMIEQGLKECDAPIDFKFGVEYNPKVAEVYRQNHGNHLICDDVRNIIPARLPRVDWFHASPVCCRFTRVNTLNKRMGKDYAENDIDFTTACAVVAYIQHHHPTFVTIENVHEYLGSDSYHIIIQGLEREGYTIQTGSWRDCNIGGFTGRTRMIVRASIALGVNFPQPKKINGCGKWYEIVAPYVEKTPRKLAKHNAGKITPSILAGRYDPSKTCFVDYRSGVHFIVCAYLNMCAPGITASSYREPFMVHFSNEYEYDFHRVFGSQVWFNLHNLWKYKCDSVPIAIYVCGNGIPRSFVENVMLPFVLQQATGELEQGILL